ncbi:MAG TPA: hypothetical protein VLE95_00130 [Chlamydiales bacterium]|nr:hypothetical protein [Chlamydiales bacterium]
MKPRLKRLLILANNLEMTLQTILSAPTKWSKTELAANQFRMTHTREKLKLEKIKNQRDAMETHEMVGREVRAAIAKIGVAMPENIPPAEPIKNVEKRLKKAKPKLLLERQDSGLLPHNSSNDLKP